VMARSSHGPLVSVGHRPVRPAIPIHPRAEVIPDIRDSFCGKRGKSTYSYRPKELLNSSVYP